MAGGPAAIGVDIGGTNLRVARIGADGCIRQKVVDRSDRDPTRALNKIIELIAGVDDPDVRAIGIGVPGRVDHHRRDVLSGGYLDLSSMPAARLIEDRIGRPVVVDNDCNMALIAEAVRGAGRSHANIVMLTIGTGIGGAVLQEGRILRGHRSAGQLGHVCIDRNGRTCVCGRRGCVETESSGTAFGRHVAEAGYPPETKAEALLSLARQHDPKAIAVLECWAGPLRAAIESIAATLDPGLLLLGGGLGREAMAALDLAPPSATWFRTDIRAASLGDDAGVIGAGLAALRAPAAAARGAGPGKSVLLVNGVPASGKSRLAHEIAQRTGWPILSLDTIKNPFLEQLGGGDRLFNRTLGKASYQALWSIIADAPAGSTFIADAWFGFQPAELLEGHIGMAGVGRLAEIWCHAPGTVVAERYRSRLDQRPAGHPGADYIPELIQLAARANPTGLAPLLCRDTTQDADYDAIAAWAMGHLAAQECLCP